MSKAQAVVTESGAGPSQDVERNHGVGLLPARLMAIASLLEAVDARCMAADGPVTKTRHEITDAELRDIYILAAAPESGQIAQ